MSVIYTMVVRWHHSCMDVERPVIAGAGQLTVREPDAYGRSDPVSLMKVAVQRACADIFSGDFDLSSIEAVRVVNTMSWRYAPNAAQALCAELQIAPASVSETDVGGHQPVAALDELSTLIAAGRIQCGVVCGAEAQFSLTAAKKLGKSVDWPAKPARGSDRPTDHLASIVNPEAWRHGLRFPVNVYPLFENAYRARRALTFERAQEQSSELWSAMSKVASTNDFAWFGSYRSPDEIATPSPVNRWVGFPYTKLMNAAPNVDQAAAVIVMSARLADELGVPVERRVFPVGAARCNDIADFLRRPSFDRSRAMEAVLDSTLERSGLRHEPPEDMELYSCFPVVPSMARDHLCVPRDNPLTVTGGLSFFGGPGNNYMTHALAAMVDRLRTGIGGTGLVYGQGEFVTKHAAMVLSAHAPRRDYGSGVEPLALESEIRAEATVGIDPRPNGRGTIETFTAVQTPEGWLAMIIGRLHADGRRFVGQCHPGDPAVDEALLSLRAQGVGAEVFVTAADPVNTIVMA